MIAKNFNKVKHKYKVFCFVTVIFEISLLLHILKFLLDNRHKNDAN